MFYNSSNSFEYNDCVSKGACSISPAISSMQEVMLILLRQIAYYLLKLKEFKIANNEITFSLIYQITLFDAVKDFSEYQVLNLFSKHYKNLVKVRKEYLKICQSNNEKCHDLKNLLRLNSETNLSSILNKGDREFLAKYKKLKTEKKYSEEILTAVIKSVCSNLMSLYEYNCQPEYACDKVLEGLNIFNSSKIDYEAVKKYAEILSKIDAGLLKLLREEQMRTFGNIENVEVSASTKPNKAILVSGSNLSDLKNLLEYVKDTDIDVYTNGNLLISHAFSYFNNLKNLKGHFGTGSMNTILDFATFPGAILLTKNEAQNIEYLYRGRLFTTDEIAPKGVVKIKDNDFLPLIESAMQAKGFAKGQQRNPISVGFSEIEFNSFLDKVISTDFRKLFIIGNSNLNMKNNDYFQKLFTLLPDSCYAVSFSYNPRSENVFYANLCNNYPLISGVLQKIFEKIPLNSDKLAFFLTKCDLNSFSNIINLKNEGAKNIFLSDCPPTIVNPSVLNSFSGVYKINQLSDPETDLKKII